MSERIYFLVDSLSSANSVVDHLKQHGVAESSIGVISHQDNIELTNLPEADLTEESDVTNALQRGAATGAATGLAAGLVAAAFPPSGLVIGGMALLGITGAGAAVGAWSASLIGISEQHPLVEQFQTRIDSGSILIVSDVEEDEADRIAGQIGSNIGLESDAHGVFNADG